MPKSELVISAREHVREQVGEQEKNAVVRQLAAKPSKFVQKLLCVLKDEMTVLEMMGVLKLGGRRNFLERYLIPAKGEAELKFMGVTDFLRFDIIKSV